MCDKGRLGMLKKKYGRLIIGIVIVIAIISVVKYIISVNKAQHQDYVKVTYLPIYKVWHAEDVQGDLLTHVNIAFATINSDFTIAINPVKGLDLAEEINKLKKLYPHIKINLSIGGWGADGFSDLASTKQGREKFINSVITYLKQYDLDGVDIDWEFPGQDASGLIKTHPEDPQNFTLLMKELSSSLGSLKTNKNQKYQLSFAAPFSNWAVQSLAIKEVGKYVDYIYLMGYDFVGTWAPKTGHHSNLKDNDSASIHLNVYQGIQEYLKACDAEKLVLGVPAYGYGWHGVTTNANGLFQNATGALSGEGVNLSYTNLKENYIDKNGFKRYWDDTSKAAFLYNGDTWVTYEDLEAIQKKAELVKKTNLGGMMYWEQTQDTTGDIIRTISEQLDIK